MATTAKLLRTPSPGHHTPYICRSCLRNVDSKGLRRYASGSITREVELGASAKPNTVVPLRKQLKDEAKHQKRESVTKKTSLNRALDKWELTVGIEIHAELNTATKLFSTAATSINDSTNKHVAHFDAAIPGTQPQFQKETIIPALRAALALNCKIQPKSAFDRKHYFYQDQPAGYQITQYYGNANWPPLSIEKFATTNASSLI